MRVPSFLYPLFLGAACSQASTEPSNLSATMRQGGEAVTQQVADDLDAVVSAARDLQAVAPVPTDRGWDATTDAAAIQSMQGAWRRARAAFDHVQGAMAALYPEMALSIDGRYDDFLAAQNGAPDYDAFDEEGVTGLQAIERILWVGQIPQRVIDDESVQIGYLVAALPRTPDEALEFKTKLVQKLIDDITTLRSRWVGVSLDAPSAMVALSGMAAVAGVRMGQAAELSESSRYAQVGLDDLRNALDGMKNMVEAFRPWILAHTGGDQADMRITASLSAAAKLYAGFSGDALPVPPDSWHSDSPSNTDLATPFGRLWTGVNVSFEPTQYGSVAYELDQLQ
jgi:iron uptake system component EfeO